jgi:hypothetical protein
MFMSLKTSLQHLRLTGFHLTAVCLITCVGFTLAVSARGWWAASRVTSSSNTGSIIASGKPTPIRIDSELITINPYGFYPKEITRPKGLFLLAVDNRSGIHELSLQLNLDNGGRVKEKPLLKGQLRWRQPIDLNPGNYVLTEANHPDWVCHLTITAK